MATPENGFNCYRWRLPLHWARRKLANGPRSWLSGGRFLELQRGKVRVKAALRDQ